MNNVSNANAFDLKCLKCDIVYAPEPFFHPENVTALSKEEKKSCEGLVNVKNVQMRSKILKITKPQALMVCQLNSTVSFGLTFVTIC